MIRQAVNCRLSAVFLLSTGIFVSACTPGQFFAVEGVSAAATDKTVTDHVVSLFSGKNCSFLRTEQGRSYCIEDASIINQSNLYCYRTLGSVTCYNEPDPQQSPSDRLGFIDEANNQQ